MAIIEISPTCGVPQAQRPSVSNHGGFCFLRPTFMLDRIQDANQRIIDGFNLYYRLLKDNPSLKWLDLRALSAQLLQPQNQIQTVRYYTARISGRVDPTAPARQQVYLDALQTVPEITIHLGNFLITKPWAGLVHLPQMKGGNCTHVHSAFPGRRKSLENGREGQRCQSRQSLDSRCVSRELRCRGSAFK